VLNYEPRGNALEQVPSSSYNVDETLADYSVAGGSSDNFLAIVLNRMETHCTLPGFADNFRANFEAFLQSADTDPTFPGIQPYRNPEGDPILRLAATRFFGPAQTWPQELENHPYIEFWHRLDAALAAAAIPGIGLEVIGDRAWQSLFSSGSLAENPGIRVTIRAQPQFVVRPLGNDQLGRTRPSSSPADIGAIEMP
jgi:hypothetical protein